MWNKNSPYWVKINAPASDTGINDDLKASTVKGKDVHRDCMKNLEVNEDSLYFQYVTIQRLEIVSPSGITSLGTQIKKCFLQSIEDQEMMAFSVTPLKKESKHGSFKRLLRFLQHTDDFDIDQIGLRRRKTLDPKAMNDFFTGGTESFKASAKNNNNNNNNNNTYQIEIRINGIQTWNEIQFPKVGTFSMDKGGKIEAILRLPTANNNPPMVANLSGEMLGAVRTNKTVKIAFKNLEDSKVEIPKEFIFFEPESGIELEVMYSNQTAEHSFNAPTFMDFSLLMIGLQNSILEIQKSSLEIFQQIEKKLGGLVSMKSVSIKDVTLQFHKYLELRRTVWIIMSRLTAKHPAYKPLLQIIGITDQAQAILTKDLLTFQDTDAVLNQVTINSISRFCLADAYCLEPHNLTIIYDRMGVQCDKSSTGSINTFTKIVGTLISPEIIDGVITIPTGGKFDACLAKDNLGLAYELTSNDTVFEFYYVNVQMSLLKIRRDRVTLSTPEFDFELLGKVTRLTARTSLESVLKGDRSAIVEIDGSAEGEAINGSLFTRIIKKIDDQLKEINQSMELRVRNLHKAENEAKRDFDSLSDSMKIRSQDLKTYQSRAQSIKMNMTQLSMEKLNVTHEIELMLNSTKKITAKLTTDFKETCYPQECPLYKCIPGVITKLCKKVLTKNVTETVCKYLPVTRMRKLIIRVKTNQTRLVWRQKRVCFAQCPVHFGYSGLLRGWGGRYRNDYYWQCRQRWYMVPIPIFVWKWQDRLVKITTSELICQQQIRQIEISSQSTTICQEASNCVDVRLINDTSSCQHHNKTRCEQIKTNIFESKTSNPQLESKLNETRRISELLELYAIQLRAIERNIANLETTIAATNATLGRIQKKIDKFNSYKLIIALQQIREEALIEKNHNIKDAITVKQVLFRLQHQPRHTYPRQIQLSIILQEKLTHATETMQLAVSNFPFDLASEEASLRKLAIKIISEAIQRKMRQRRSIEPSSSADTQKDKTSSGDVSDRTKIIIEDCTVYSYMHKFILTFVEGLESELARYNRSLAMHNLMAEEQQQLEKFIIGDVSPSTMTDSTDNSNSNNNNNNAILNSIRKEINGILNYNTFPTLHQTFIEFMARPVSFTEYGCLGYLDCFTSLLNNILLQLNSEKLTTQVKWTRGRLFQMRDDLLDIINNGCRDLNKCKAKVDILLETVRNPKLYTTYCGKPPTIIQNPAVIDGVLDLKVNQNLNLSITVDSDFPTTVYWYLNEKLLPLSRTANFTKVAEMSDSGYYTCSVSNKYGERNCGAIQVNIYQEPIIHQNEDSPLKPVKAYLNSPEIETQRLLCNVSNAESIEWFHREFNGDVNKKVGSTRTLDLIQQGKNQESKKSVLSSGHYWCKAFNKMFSTISDPVLVLVSSTEFVIPQIALETKFSIRKNQATRRRRYAGSDIERLAMRLNITKTQIVSINITDDQNKITIIVQGKKIRAGGDGQEESKNWNDNIAQFASERDNLMKIADIFYKEASSPKGIELAVKDGTAYKLQSDSLLTKPLPSQCADGMELLDNGFVCGKKKSLFSTISLLFKPNLAHEKLFIILS